LPEKPYALASGDEVIFTGQYQVPGSRRVEDGILGTIIETSGAQDRVTVKTKEHEQREVELRTGDFSEISLAYAAHVRKGQGH
jgi:ATP-dependent exoDNAse (exonuclease V) alpha subunit